MVKRGLLFYGAPLDIEPHEALIWEVERTAGHVAFLDADIAQLDLKESGLEPDEFDIRMRRAQTLYQAERKHLVNVCQAALAAGVEERRVQLAERTGQLIAELFEAVFADLGLSKKQKEKAPAAVRKHLAVYEGGRQAA